MNYQHKQEHAVTLLLLGSKFQVYKSFISASEKIPLCSLVVHILLNTLRKHQNNTSRFFFPFWQLAYYSRLCFEKPWNTKAEQQIHQKKALEKSFFLPLPFYPYSLSDFWICFASVFGFCWCLFSACFI